ncbi:leucine-rich repeat domain-containing protein [Stieleria marina]
MAFADDIQTSPKELYEIAADLENPRFGVRESASRRLKLAGKSALPVLKSTIETGSLESVSRSLEILRLIHLRSNQQVSHEASAIIHSLSDLTTNATSQRTIDTIALVRNRWAQSAKQQLQELGVDFKYRSFVTVTIEKEWAGTDRDLRLLQYISGLGTLNISKSPIRDNGLPEIATLPDLQTLRVRIQGSGLIHLRHLPSLTFLSLKYSQLAPDALAGLTGCEKLQSLGLDDTNVTDAAIACLPTLPNLRDLWLNGTRVTHRGLAQVKRMPKIRKLILTGLDLKGPGLFHLTEMPTLEYISLKHSTCDDSCLRAISRLTQVKSLGLDDTQVTDAGMAQLDTLTFSLETLWLTNDNISDESIQHLEKLVAMKQLYLTGTQVTPQGLAEIRNSLPDCRVTFEPSSK